jgi:hypothetical protein
MMIDPIQGLRSMQAMGQMQAARPLTSEQKTQVQDILSQYDPSNLTTEDAKAIFKSFKEAGIKGPGLKDAIQEAGFDPEKIRGMAQDGQKVHHAVSKGAGQINTAALQSLQNILNQFNLTDMSSDQQDDLMSQLTSSGLMNSGSMIDLKM